MSLPKVNRFFKSKLHRSKGTTIRTGQTNENSRGGTADSSGTNNPPNDKSPLVQHSTASSLQLPQERRAYIDNLLSTSNIVKEAFQGLNDSEAEPRLALDGEGDHQAIYRWTPEGASIRVLEIGEHRNEKPPCSAVLTNSQLLEIATGLEYLHSERIVHGDLRGDNIMINDRSVVKITDFGLAVIADATTTDAHREGNARWLCPYFFSGKVLRPDYWCDVYSYGCVCVEVYSEDHQILYEFENGKRSGDFMRYRNHALTQNPRRPASADTLPEMTNELWEVVQSCWIDPRENRSTPSDLNITSRMRESRSVVAKP
ncbi:hypothetical protein NLI96_g11626 [Meripilus lineatus]|uniref:Protein kinase domain-containing protein n=1 Tax=Meripilus lineatus TaxID=2056292 RepID=A0AAD5USV2_9APHY|nr:hypothetical protein NLI96_g11626 [Physisporinus lineatus]